MISSFANSGATAKRENKNLNLSCQSDAQDRPLWRSMRPHSQIRVSIQIMEGYCGPGKPRQRRRLTAEQDWPAPTLRLRALVGSRPCMARMRWFRRVLADCNQWQEQDLGRCSNAARK